MWVLQKRSPCALQLGGGGGGRRRVAAVAPVVPLPSADGVEGLGGPGDHLERVECDHSPCRAALHGVVDPLGAVSADVRELRRTPLAERVEEHLDGGFVASFGRSYEPAGVVVGDDGDVALPLAVRQIVDSDPHEPVEQVRAASGAGYHSGHDGGFRPPGDPQQFRHRRRRRMRGQPGALVFERSGESGAAASPGHRRDPHAMVRAPDPRSVRLEIRLDRSAGEVHLLDHELVDTKQLLSYPSAAHEVSLPVVFELRTARNVDGERRCALRPPSPDPREQRKMPIPGFRNLVIKPPEIPLTKWSRRV